MTRQAVLRPRGLRTGLSFRRVGLERGRSGFLHSKVRGEILKIPVGKLFGERAHLRVLAPPVAKLHELIHNEQLRLAGERWYCGVRAVPRFAMTRDADLPLRATRLDIRAERRGDRERPGDESSDSLEQSGAAHLP